MFSGIRILEPRANARGDLFAQLMKDLFATLGYDQDVWVNVPDSGREIDLKAFHRTERRRAIAECKAWQDRIGGDEVNKFFGALDAERREARKTAIVGYFISLSGFKATTLQQEERSGAQRLVLMDGKQVADQLVTGNVIIGPHLAMERAGRSVGRRELEPEASCELLATHNGWVWCVYYTEFGQRTHYALIHGDGTPLSSEVALVVSHADRSVGGHLHTLDYLSPDAELGVSAEECTKAHNWYLQYLENECGGIVLDGLPAEQEVRSRRLALESLFVPLHVIPHKDSDWETDRSKNRSMLDTLGMKEAFGRVLQDHDRLAILALPGGGKSTLLKRVAVAYAFPERRRLIDDLLPDRECFPLLIRCRQLGNLAHEPITRIIRSIPEKAEMGYLAEAFEVVTRNALQNSRVLLLVDGLDEIADPRTRGIFASQLRTFLARYPGTRLILTSRPAGFRHVAHTISSYCSNYELAEFDDDDIHRLTKAWHAEVVSDSASVASEARNLASVICSTDRIRRLATNPLMLTTLLLVKRWVGHLPSLRHELYERTIDVLLITWNVEAHQRLEKDEVIPRLSFVAFTMMREGIQRISSTQLLRSLASARRQMPEILEWATLRDPEFVQRVEDRSSLLMMTGRSRERGQTVETYEFRHLTFQEYLAAVAVVSGYYPGAQDGDTILDVIRPYIGKDDWKEVVPLVAVLADRRQVQPLIQHLISICNGEFSLKKAAPEDLLAQCLIDGVQIPRSLVLEAVARIIQYKNNYTVALYKSKYGDAVEAYVRSRLGSRLAKADPSLIGAMQQIVALQIGWDPVHVPEPSEQTVDKVLSLLTHTDVTNQIAGCGLAMEILFNVWHRRPTTPSDRALLRPWGERLSLMLNSDDPSVIVAAAWAMAHLGKCRAWDPLMAPNLMTRLFTLWSTHTDAEVVHYTSFAMKSLPVVGRSDVVLPQPSPDQLKFILAHKDADRDAYSHSSREAALVAAYYLGSPLDDPALGAFAADILSVDFELQGMDNPRWVEKTVAESILKTLGEYGSQLIKRVDEARVPRRVTRNRNAT